MIGIGILSGLVAPVIGNARDYPATGSQDSVELFQNVDRTFDMFQRFKTDDHVDTIVRNAVQAVG
ncbi:hypothetical protein BIZ92_01505 [Achromobacter xylosoxidans]|uniref:Uncharacterized protein n=1 Tax=Alcaligenes xylosoxydans xylosoxydans TaxID=85698 RepID=A0A1R1K0X1_ALCXX|nr:hypothetical protein BIZ92_01505 [Achromobacter xylosoxidans]